ncbi:amyloid fiber anchoring/assembly protein TapA [Sediminibacillus albus]|uniref:TasA anchoring/assembly protein n=1 Tax=Sediminibacillus albus TaxID=407036 RepID=A0A1G9B7X9_9BACI|nr:amyloid fiber anchoring/assembly protein TapA [Sediminibacillus albus]SDK35578.1 TasA anchoring/assembly protein [Sediminibacillus albus]
MRSSRLVKYRKKYKKAGIAVQILAIWYVAICSAAMLTSSTGAYFNDSSQAITAVRVGTWETDQWDKSSLVFPNENKDRSVNSCEPAQISASLKNGGESMEITSTYEVYYAEKGNPKQGEKLPLAAGEGVIEKLENGAEIVLTFLAGAPGNYKFKAYQVDGHPGKGELWSETIKVECKEAEESKASEADQQENETNTESTEVKDEDNVKDNEAEKGLEQTEQKSDQSSQEQPEEKQAENNGETSTEAQQDGERKNSEEQLKAKAKSDSESNIEETEKETEKQSKETEEGGE